MRLSVDRIPRQRIWVAADGPLCAGLTHRMDLPRHFVPGVSSRGALAQSRMLQPRRIFQPDQSSTRASPWSATEEAAAGDLSGPAYQSMHLPHAGVPKLAAAHADWDPAPA